MNRKYHTKHESRRSLYTGRPPDTKRQSLLMTNQNTTSPALHHQNQPPDSGSVHESQRWQLWLSLHCSHRHTCCVCFRLECFTIFRGEKRRSLDCSSSSHQKSVSADEQIKTQQAQSFIARTNLLTMALYMSDSGSSFDYRCIAVTAIHTLCAFLRMFYNFPWERSGTTDLSRRPNIFVKAAI